MINSIKNKGFDKYENEKIKNQKKDKSENSNQILKSKIKSMKMKRNI